MKQAFLTSVFFVIMFAVNAQTGSTDQPRLAEAEKKDSTMSQTSTDVASPANGSEKTQSDQSAGKSNQPVGTPELSEASEPKRKD